jgi:uroporphyrinogen decarboxylase
MGVDWARLRKETDDIMHLVPNYTGPELPENTDIWGIRRKSVAYGDGSYDEIEHYPLAGITNIEQIDGYSWPHPDWYDYASSAHKLESAGKFRAVKLTGGNPFEIYCWMTGLEEAMVNLILSPKLVRCALGHITGFFEARLHRTLKDFGGLVDIVFFADDLGSQQGLLLSRECYRKVIQPFHRRLTATVKELAPHAKCMMHSDGAVFDILPDLIDAGVEILEAVQVDAKGMIPERLKSAFGNKLSFHGGISVQELLPHGNTGEVRKECLRLINVFGEGGGYIAAPTHAVQAGTPPENVMAMLGTVLGKDLNAVLEKAKL